MLSLKRSKVHAVKSLRVLINLSKSLLVTSNNGMTITSISTHLPKLKFEENLIFKFDTEFNLS